MLTERTKKNIINGLLILLLFCIIYYGIIIFNTISDVKHISNLYKEYLISTNELTSEQTILFKDNIRLISRCLHKTLKENNININNLTVQSLTENIAKYNAHCDEKQLAAFRFLKRYYMECSDDIIIDYVKKNIGQEQIPLKLRTDEYDFDEFTPIERMNIKLFITDQKCISSNRCIKDKDCFNGKLCNIDRRCICPPGSVECFGSCKDVSMDIYNCGACGRKCDDKQICNQGFCQ